MSTLVTSVVVTTVWEVVIVLILRISESTNDRKKSRFYGLEVLNFLKSRTIGKEV